MPATVLAPVSLATDDPPPRRLALIDPDRGLRAPAHRQIRVLIADAHALVRAGFRILLEGCEHITVVAEAARGDETVTRARRLQPDVVLMDTTLPGLDAVEATRRIATVPGVRVMMLTTGPSEESALASLRAGASGFLAKDTEPAELLRAVRVIARGDPLLSPALTRRLIAEVVAQPDPRRAAPEELDELTAREREATELAARGLTNAEIAERLAVTAATAKTHISRAMVKLRVCDRAKLVALAYQSGLVESAAVPGDA